ncbi:MAG: peptidoglycan-binding protein [Ilumatobacteraceae bacterium]
MASIAKRGRRRAIVTGVVCVALAAGAAVAIAIRKPKAESSVETPSIFKTATVSTGDLTTSERVDGIVQLSSTLAVLHRIEGQASSSSATTPTATTTPANPASLSSPLVVGDCPTNSVATTTPEPITIVPTTPIDTTPPGTNPTGSTPDTTPTAATTTTTAAPVPSSAPAATPPAQTCDTSTTNPAVTPDTAAVGAPTAGGPTVNAPTANAPTAGARTGASGSTTGATAAASSATRITQTITSIIGVNAAVQQGDVLYTVDGTPVVALDGALPAWRSLSTASDDGKDVGQLETSLVALGYDPDLKVTIDNHFDSATRTMVKAWQGGLGVEATGTVALGAVVFLPTSTTVSSVGRVVGDTVGDGDTVLTLAAPTQEVLVDVPAGDEAQVIPGLTVDIGDVRGTVSRLRSADRDGAVIVEAVVVPATPIENASNGTSVKVTITLQNEAGALIAPAEALVSRLDGTYAVQAQTPDGSTKWLTVELLGVSGGNVAIRGTDVSEGTVLLLPA